jgi:uncharacterized protein YciI
VRGLAQPALIAMAGKLSTPWRVRRGLTGIIVTVCSTNIEFVFTPMPYVLVILRAGANEEEDLLHAPAHERFISSLIKQNLVLLGGAFAEALDDAYAAYVLRCSGLEEARAIVATDPFVIHSVVRPECVVWELVGINPDAIDSSAVVRPEDA